MEGVELYKRLMVIEEDLADIKQGIRRNDNHISFVTRMYFILQRPLLKLLNYLGYDIENETNNDNHFYKIL